MNNLLTLRAKILLIELALAIALGSAVVGFSDGITRQSYTNALIVAALVLVPLEVLRQSGVLQRLIELLRERGAPLAAEAPFPREALSEVAREAASEAAREALSEVAREALSEAARETVSEVLREAVA